MFSRIKRTGKMMSAKQLGEVMGLSAQKVNELLKKKGFIEGKPGAYEVTAKGKKYSELRVKGNGYGGFAARSWEFLMWDEGVLRAICKDRFPGIRWFCDKCEAPLNLQKGFTDHKKSWKCKECGYVNEISEKSIRK